MPVWVFRVLSVARKVPWTRVIAAVGWLATVGRKVLGSAYSGRTPGSL